MKRLQPNVVLLSTDGRDPQAGAPPGGELSNYVASLGFETVDRKSLPGGCEKLQVLVRRRGGNGREDKPRS